MVSLSPQSKATLTCALLGGIVAVPLTVGHNWLSGMGSEFSVDLVFVGGLLAGYRAARGSGASGRAGLGAGLVGGLPALIWIWPAMVRTTTQFASAWSVPAAVLGLVLLVMVVAVPAFAGLLGGVVGGWLAEKAEARRLSVQDAF
ncbi:MAG: DUF5518 domain-containing protein [Haloplanus sp.]